MLLVHLMIAVLRSETALRVWWTKTGTNENLLDTEFECLPQQT